MGTEVAESSIHHRLGEEGEGGTWGALTSRTPRSTSLTGQATPRC